MITHVNFVGLQTKKYQIRLLTATVTSFLALKWPNWWENALLKSKLEICLSESLQTLTKWSLILTLLVYRQKISNSASDRHCGVNSSPKMTKLVGKCAVQVRTRDLLVRTTSNNIASDSALESQSPAKLISIKFLGFQACLGGGD